MTITAVFEGNDPSALATAQSLASGALQGVSIFTGQASWQDYTGSVGWEEGLWSGFSGVKLWSVPLFANGSDLHSAAQGAYDGYYADVAKTLASGQSSGPIYVRTGWEFNGSWEAWSAKGHEADYVGAFQQFVNTFRGVSNRFVFTWSPTIGDQGMDPSTAYPGDKYVDIIGDDFYYNTQWYSADPGKAWSSMVNQTYGLQWLENFAAAHGKPTAYPEWGVNTNAAGPYIAAAANWFSSHNVVYQSYWDSDADFAGKISDGAMPAVGAAYLAAFVTGAHTSSASDASTLAATSSAASAAAASALTTSGSTTSALTTAITGPAADTHAATTATHDASATAAATVATLTTGPAAPPAGATATATATADLPAAATTAATLGATAVPDLSSATSVSTDVSMMRWVCISGLVAGRTLDVA